MDAVPVVDAALFLITGLCAALIGAGEAAVEAASRSKLESGALDGDARATACLALKDRHEDFHGSVQISLTLLTVIGVILAFPAMAGMPAPLLALLPASLPAGLVTAVLFLLGACLIAGYYVVAGLLAARGIGVRYADSLALRAARPMLLLARLFRIPGRLLTGIANVVLRPAGGAARFNEPVLSEESLMDMLEESTKTGILDRTEHELIESIFEFTDTTAREVMIPRTEIIAIDSRMAPEQILEIVVQEGFTRMPVYRGSVDNIIGIVYAKDVLSIVEHRDLIILADIIRPPFFVPETKPISELLREFQKRRIHLAVVVDEFGGTEGLITLEDILEEIVGEIRDEYDEETRPYDVLADGSVEVEGRTNISDFNHFASLGIPESDDYDTVGGFVTTLMGKIPVAGERFTYRNLVIDIIAVDEHRVDRIRITPRHDTPPSDTPQHDTPPSDTPPLDTPPLDAQQQPVQAE